MPLTRLKKNVFLAYAAFLSSIMSVCFLNKNHLLLQIELCSELAAATTSSRDLLRYLPQKCSCLRVFFFPFSYFCLWAFFCDIMQSPHAKSGYGYLCKDFSLLFCGIMAGWLSCSCCFSSSTLQLFLTNDIHVSFFPSL